ncbi:hypothetical protein [Mesorhizobium sp. B2-7-1]|uniref:hypothetical protein n=1 Tax=Mesorhizobium sp. B2-7-1 TaxID=2589909 RepID=UPI00112A8541|nr:hypothetical protein [Mesorhizobium sp. B2-7-1]TPJ52280.1 hypothetical protein FJ471_28265 [Mesorhizobium sp. B2-7-1]
MLFAIVCAACIGLAIGLKLRAPALIVATLVVVGVNVVTDTVLQLPFSEIVRSTLYLVVATQGAYLVGLALSLVLHNNK